WLEVGGDDLECCGDDVERGIVDRSAGHGPDEQLEQLGLAEEEHLSLVGEVPEERAFGEPRAFRDVCDGRLLEAALEEEVHSGEHESSTGVGLPSAHGSDGTG